MMENDRKSSAKDGCHKTRQKSDFNPMIGVIEQPYPGYYHATEEQISSLYRSLVLGILAQICSIFSKLGWRSSRFAKLT